MSIIKVFAGRDGGRAAGAVAGALSARLSKPLATPGRGESSRPEKTQRKNPHQLTRDQHVYPVRTMLRFADKDGRVDLHDLVRGKHRRTKVREITFCAKRAWDQRAEAGYMKETEKAFQSLAASIVDGHVQSIVAEQTAIVTRMYALWHMRSRYRALGTQQIKLNGLQGDDLSDGEEERLEKTGSVFIRDGGMIPARLLNGLEIEHRANAYARDLAVIDRWGVIRAQAGEFIVPDIPNHTIVPIAPRVALVSGVGDGLITAGNLAELNQAVRAACVDYFFARDFSACPFVAEA